MAYVRRGNKRLLTRALFAASAFFAAMVIGVALFASAPKNEAGTAVGPRADLGIGVLLVGALVAAGLAAAQRDPLKALSARK